MKIFKLDIVLKVFTLIAFFFFAYNIFDSFTNNHNKLLLLLLFGEAITMILVIFSKSASNRNFSLISIVLTLSATFYFFFINLNVGVAIIQPSTSGIIMFFAVIWQIVSKICLGRNFGLLPAYRGIVTYGPYRIVRHPIYLGYFIMHMSFLLGNFSIYNALLYTLLYALQFGRIFYEEKILQENEEYAHYMKKVKYRFIPFLV